jgi:hypothetical protein
LDLESEGMKKEISQWPLVIWNLAKLSQADRVREEKNLPTPPLIPFQALAAAAGTLTSAVQRWPSGTEVERAANLELLAEERAKAAEVEAKYHAHIGALGIA